MKEQDETASDDENRTSDAEAEATEGSASSSEKGSAEAPAVASAAAKSAAAEDEDDSDGEDSDEDDSDEDDSDEDDSDEDDSDEDDSDEDDSDEDDSDEDDSDEDDSEEAAAAEGGSATASKERPAKSGEAKASKDRARKPSKDRASKDRASRDRAPKDRAPKDARATAEPEGSSTPLIVVAGLIAVATVGAVWWWNNRTDTGEQVSIDDTADVRPAADAVDEPANPFAALGDLQAPQRPPGLPAPADVAAPPQGAARTESGLASRVIEAGTGTDHPSATDRVTVHYTGWTTDGAMFDSSRQRGEPATFPLDGVIPGWTEGVQLMVVGEKRRFWIPEALAYRGRPGAPAGMLVFDVELLSFEPTPPPPPVPDDVAAVPANAERSESGLAWRVLEAGTGQERPTDTSLVRVNLTGWTTDGEMFDSTTSRGEPLTVPIGMLSVPGLREGLSLMVEGEKRRFWLPPDLAFAGRPGAPQGMVVFDIELVGMIEMPAGMGMPGMPPGAGGPPGAGRPGAPPGHPGARPGAPPAAPGAP